MSEPTQPRKSYRRSLGAWVANETTALATGGRYPDGTDHGGYVDKDPAARYAVAILAHAAGHKPGDDPDILPWTIPPETIDPWDGTGISNAEWSAFATLTLFAVHQKGKDTPMHVNDGTSIGRALGTLCWNNQQGDPGIRRAFARLENAREWPATVRHARSIVRLLAREDIPMDYGTLADDLNALRYGGDSKRKVLVRWSRDLQRGYATARDASNTTDNTTDK